jgi:hypothetical protein
VPASGDLPRLPPSGGPLITGGSAAFAGTGRRRGGGLCRLRSSSRPTTLWRAVRPRPGPRRRRPARRAPRRAAGGLVVRRTAGALACSCCSRVAVALIASPRPHQPALTPPPDMGMPRARVGARHTDCQWVGQMRPSSLTWSRSDGEPRHGGHRSAPAEVVEVEPWTISYCRRSPRCTGRRRSALGHDRRSRRTAPTSRRPSRRAEHPVAHVVDRRVGCRGGRGQAAGLDDGAATGGDGRDVGVGDPGLVDEVGGDLPSTLVL